MNYNAVWIASLPEKQRNEILAALPVALHKQIIWLWKFWARDDQLAPAGEWSAWLMLGGRGAGKTRAGAEWVRASVTGKTPLAKGRRARIALVGETISSAREVMVEGESGIMAISPPWERPKYEASRRRLIWPNGAQAQLFSAEDPDGLRGPQFDGAWADELAKWRHGRETWDMLQFGMRLGADPRQVITTTPRPVKLLRDLLADPNIVVSRAASYANAANLAPQFFARITAQYEGTRLGRQELMAELLEDNPDALWSRAQIDAGRVNVAAEMPRIVVGIDPPAASTVNSDTCGIIVAGLGTDGHGYVLADYSVQGVSPQVWASRAVAAYRDFQADRLVAEVNQGGDMVEAVIRQVDRHAPVRSVRASRGKTARAEPVSALYEQGRVHHVGAMPALEDEMAEFTRGFNRADAGWSPDRVDALVWAITELMLTGEAGVPRVRRL
ncbi:MAG TPA: terminase family protein [Alphaproteobacteria bacterium]|nr:terminase family protein [Alphaproteobacteria bacterium]